jgi:peptidoglycan/LPS O-acetylase OafA/YrhL
MTPSAVISQTPRFHRMPRLPVLNGWRGISIVAVLMAHMLPLGPKHLELNVAGGLFGMAIFFTLSGFLITSTLYYYANVRTFFIHRLCRIVPLAWLYMILVLPFLHASFRTWLAHLFFFANLPPGYLNDYTAALWSLCVEMQFYLFIGILFLILGRKGLWLLPILCVAVSINCVRAGVTQDIDTIYRVAEILSGASLAIFFHGRFARHLKHLLAGISPLIPLVLLCISCYHSYPWTNYFRPYFASLLVGTTLYHKHTVWNLILESSILSYLATISYALYVWHQPFHAGWWEKGGKVARYLWKRPLGLALTFLIAHFSTFYYEKYWINLGKHLSEKSPKNALFH